MLRAKAKYENSARDWKAAAKNYAQKKFFQKDVAVAIKNIFCTHEYDRMLIYGKLKEPRQILIIEKQGIRCISIKDLIDDAAKNGIKTQAFTEMHGITHF